MFADFQEFKFFTKLKTFKTHFLKFLSFINLPCGHVMSHKKLRRNQFSRFDDYWIQTDRQAKFIHRSRILKHFLTYSNQLVRICASFKEFT